MSELNKKYGPWAVVTGASTGIGKSISHILAQNGLKIVAVARNEKKLNDLKQQLEMKYAAEVETISLDLSLPESATELDKRTEHLDVGLLIANAGVENNGAFDDHSEAEISQLIALNVNSPLVLAHKFTRRFKQRGGGGILLTASLFGYQGVPYFANYAASKAYVIALGEALNVELKPFGIDVTVVSPGLTETPMTEDLPIDFNKIPITEHQPDYVAQVAVNALGKTATVIPGAVNKMYAWQNRLVPRSWPVKLFGFLINRARRQDTTKNLAKV